MSNLFSAKSIVLICSFSFIILFYFSGGMDIIFNIEIPVFIFPEVENIFEYNEIKAPKDSVSDKCKKAYNLGPNKWYKENCI